MVNKVTKANFRDLLDKAGYSHRIDDDGDFIVILDADNDFSHDVVIWFTINDKSTVRAFAEAVDFKISDNDLAQILIKCNDWHIKYNVGSAYVNNNRLFIQNALFLDQPVSEQFIIDNFIKINLTLFWKFFCSLS